MSSKSKLIINCAATHVSASQFSVSGGRLLLESFTTQELSYDYSAQEEWLPVLKSALSSMKIIRRYIEGGVACISVHLS